jgi:hypothetical protein
MGFEGFCPERVEIYGWIHTTDSPHPREHTLVLDVNVKKHKDKVQEIYQITNDILDDMAEEEAKRQKAARRKQWKELDKEFGNGR